MQKMRCDKKIEQGRINTDQQFNQSTETDLEVGHRVLTLSKQAIPCARALADHGAFHGAFPRFVRLALWRERRGTKRGAMLWPQSCNVVPFPPFDCALKSFHFRFVGHGSSSMTKSPSYRTRHLTDLLSIPFLSVWSDPKSKAKLDSALRGYDCLCGTAAAYSVLVSASSIPALADQCHSAL